MFNKLVDWIKSLIPFKKTGTFLPNERLIFTYFNGTKTVRADPLVLWRKVMAVGPTLSIDIKVANSQSKDAAKASLSAVTKIHEIFNIVALQEDQDGGGLTENESFLLLDTFMLFCERLKKNSPQIPTTAMVPQPNTESTSAEDLPTKNGSVSGSTKNEPSTVALEPLPTGSQSPLAVSIQD